jgi:phosphoribosylformylglycinamidine cyclo-ligase
VMRVIQRIGELDAAELYTVFNMGVGFTVTVAPGDAERALAALRGTGLEAWRLGRAVADPERKVRILPERLVGRSKLFVREP